MNYTALLNQAIKILAVRDHSKVELRKKLGKYLSEEADGEILEKVIDFCREKKYLSDERFTATLIDSLKRKGKGPLYISQKLHQHGIAADQDTLSDTQMPEEQVLELAQKKLRTLARYSFEQKKIRLMRFLSSRGFSFETVKKILDHLEEK